METNSDKIKVVLNPRHTFDFKICFQKKLTKKNGYLSSVSTLALAGCGGGGGEAENGSGASHNLPNKTVYDLTGDVVIDSMTQGSKWLFSDGTNYSYAVAGSPDGIQFSNADKISNVYKNSMQFVSDLTQVSLEYSGVSSTPLSAYSQGNEFVITMDGDGVGESFNGSPAGTLAKAGFPIVSWERPYATFAGDILLNYDSSLPYYYNESTKEGSLFNFVVVHELGHVFGLKHPHDDGDSGRPEFGAYGGLSKSLDNDFYTVMSYEFSHGGDTSSTKYDPSTFMVLDVLALQYLYGKNLATNSGDTVHKIDNVNSYRSLWDPSGNNTVDVSNSSTDWYVVLPYYVWSDLADEQTGYAVTYKNSTSTLPTDLVWLIGDFDNITAGSGDDTLIGNSFANTLVGGSGDDSIEGWEGDDKLFGGTGNDTFYFALGWGKDIVEDFNFEADTIVLLDEFLMPIDFGKVKVEVADNQTTFTLSENSKLVVKNFDYFVNQDVLNDDNLSSESENNKSTQDASSEQASNTTETESNDTLATADTLEMGTAIFGQLSSSADLDYYTFTAAQASTLQLAFDVPTSSSYNLYFIASVIDAAGNFYSSHQVGSDLSFSTALNSGGTYYVQIEDSSFYNGEQYSLTGSLSNGTSGRETEINDTIATADTLVSGGSIKGQLWWETDQDLYRVTTDGASTISVAFDAPTNSSYNNYFKVSLKDASGTVLSSQETGKDITFDTGVTNAGDYYIVVEDADFHVTEEYSISTSIIM
ncbi:hypothetical protein N8207_00760 [Planktomarina temperata]|nr:hypothetical protein [Planktomarina temperata]